MATNNPTDVSNPMTVPQGGTGDSSLATYAVLCGGTTDTDPVQSVSGLGTMGQVLTSQGPGALPIWAPSSGSGASWVLIQSQTASNSSDLTFSTGISSTYSDYFFVMSALVPQNASDNFCMQVSIDGGSTYVSSGYLCGLYYIYGTGSGFVFANENLSTCVLLGYHLDNTAGYGMSGILNCHNIATSTNAWFEGYGTFYPTTGVTSGSPYRMGGTVGSTGINAFQFTMSTGNIVSGTITLYGVSQ